MSNVVVFDGVDDFAYAPDPPVAPASGDVLDLYWFGSIDDVAGSGSTQYLAAHGGGGLNASWGLRWVDTGSGLLVAFGSDGTTVAHWSGNDGFNLPVDDGVLVGLWVHRDPVTGDITFSYTDTPDAAFTDPATLDWTLARTHVGDPGGPARPGDLLDSTGDVVIGAANTFGTLPLAGSVSYMQVRYGGTPVATFDPRTKSPGTTQWTGPQGNTWTLTGASIVGSGYTTLPPQPITVSIYDRAFTTLLADIDNQLVTARFSEQWKTPPGQGDFAIPLDHDDVPAIDPGNIVVFNDQLTGQPIRAFAITNEDVAYESSSEHAGQLNAASLAGAEILLGTNNFPGAVVYPSCGQLESYRDGQRNFGWMSCCCFDHSTWSSPAGMAHRQDDPDYPFDPTVPDDWPDPSAYRLWDSAPIVITAGANEVQSIDLGTSINSGFFTLTFDGQTTDDITSPWSASDVETALEALSNIDDVTVTGTGVSSDPYIVTFVGTDVAGRDQPKIGVNHETLNHPPQTATVTEVTKGTKGQYNSAEGDNYFYQSFSTTADTTDLIAFINLSQTGEVYIDGVEVYRQSSASAGGSTQTADFSVGPGDHCIAAHVRKEGNEGLAWFMSTVAEATEGADGNWSLGTVHVRTDETWQVFSNGLTDPPPGLTVGEIVDCLHNEAINLDNPALEPIALDFDTAVDSDGVAWDAELVYGVQIGTGYMTVMDELSDLAGVTYRVNEDLSLSIWQDRGSDLSGATRFVHGDATNDLTGGILSSDYFKTGTRATVLLVETEEDLTEAVDAAGVTAHGAQYLGVTMGTIKDTETLATFVLETFEELDEHWSLALATWGENDGQRPYRDFAHGDLIHVDGVKDSAELWQVVEVQATMMDGWVAWALSAREVVA